jgi:hypothetical protein
MTDTTMKNNDKNDRPFLSLFTIVLSVIFVVIYHCVVCHFFSLFTIVVFVIFDVIYHCNNEKKDRQHIGKYRQKLQKAQ